MTTATTFAWGALQGRIELPDAVLAGAAKLAREHHAQAEADEFCGEPVEDYLFPDWMTDRAGLLPLAELRGLGFEPLGVKHEQLLATVGVDPHEDGIHGPVAIVVLHNDGMRFKQGRQSHKTAAGEWFIFDDSRVHEVRETAKSTSYVCWSIPLKALG